MVGSGPAVSGYVMPALIARFQEESPNVRVHFRVGASPETLALIQQGQLQLGLTMPIHNHDLPMHTAYRAKLTLVSSPEYPVDPKRLDRVTLVVTSHPSTYYRFALDLFRNLRVESAHLIEVEGVETAKKMVLHGIGVALLPSTATAVDVAEGRLIEIPVKGLPIFRDTMLVESKENGDWPPLETFRNLIFRIPELVPGTFPPAK